MCGRFALGIPRKKLEEHFGVAFPAEIQTERYNIPPSETVPVVFAPEGDRNCLPMRWGLVPAWAGDPGIGERLVNARSETAHAKPSFREAFARRRCLVPAGGFYEWKAQAPGEPKTPYFIRLASGEPMALAGLWESWAGGTAEPLLTFTVLTCPPSRVLADIHDRMPVLVPPAAYSAWLDPDLDPSRVRAMCSPAPGDVLTIHRVSRRVSTPGEDGPELIRPEPPPPSQGSLL